MKDPQVKFNPVGVSNVFFARYDERGNCCTTVVYHQLQMQTRATVTGGVRVRFVVQTTNPKEYIMSSEVFFNVKIHHCYKSMVTVFEMRTATMHKPLHL